MTTPTHQRKTAEDLYDRAAPEPSTQTADTDAAATTQDTGDSEPAAKAEPIAGKVEPQAKDGAPPAPQHAKDGGHVPLKALEDERRKRQQLEREFQDLKRKIEKPAGKEGSGEPDPLIDPAGFRQHMRDEFRMETIEASRADMIDEVGEEDFGAAEAAFIAAAQADPKLAEKLQRSRDPARVAWREGKKLIEAQAKAQAEADPEVQKQKLRDEIIADLVSRGLISAPPAGTQPAASPRTPAPSAGASRPAVPTSLAGMRSASPRTAEPASKGRKSAEDLYG